MISFNFHRRLVSRRKQMWFFWKWKAGAPSRPQVSPRHRGGLGRMAWWLEDTLDSRFLHWTSPPTTSAASAAFPTFSRTRGEPRA